MKNLFAIMLVLSVSSSGFGAMAYLCVDEHNGCPVGTMDPYYFVSPSDMLLISVKADFPVRQVQVWQVNDNGEGDALGVVSEPYYTNSTLSIGAKAGDGANANNKLFAASLTTPVYSFQGIGAVVTVDPGEPIISFMYHVPESLPWGYVVTLEVFSKLTTPTAISGVKDTNNVLHSIDALNLVPEPMTLSLLSLGGLVLLRRRCA
ncbi:MAG: PEP-CTERM sorting domain-containing protein [Sedimentisphaerales bacterium]|nr:PEP-CTERM sorting domain-containing protein [Sedimentisphaerales bacterium]